MILDIAQLGDPILRVKTEELPLDEISTPQIQEFIDNLIDTKRDANGAGLAATQVSRELRIFLVEVKDNPRYPYKPEYPLTVVINPKITFLTDDRFDNFEGCLSIPNIRGVVERCPEIRVEGYDRDGNPLEQIVKGISAGTFQHELDHLDGILFMDRIKDPKTYSTGDEFKKHHEEGFKRQVEEIVGQYGS